MYLGFERNDIAPGMPSSILAKVWTVAFSSPTIVHIDAMEELNPYLTPTEFIAAGSDSAVVMTKNTQNSKTIYKGSRQVEHQENLTITVTVTIEVLNSETLSLEIEYQGYPEKTIFAE